MPLVTLLVSLALIGLLVWVLQSLIPMPAQISKVITVVAVVVCILLVLQAFGLVGSFTTLRLR